LHSQALVPIGAPADVGLFAEALVYYDRVGVYAPAPASLATLVGWFLNPGEIETFLIYLRDGVIEFVDEDPLTFRHRFLEHDDIARLMRGQWRHSRLLNYGTGRVVEMPTRRHGEGEAGALLRAAVELSRDLVLPRALAEETITGLPEADRAWVSESVPFPDVRRGVAEGRVGLREVQDLRRAGRILRAWLQGAPPRDVREFIRLHGPAGLATPWPGEKVLALAGDLRGSPPPAEEGPIIFAV